MKCPLKPIKETIEEHNRYAESNDKFIITKTEIVTGFGECDKDCAAYKECSCTLTRR